MPNEPSVSLSATRTAQIPERAAIWFGIFVGGFVGFWVWDSAKPAISLEGLRCAVLGIAAGGIAGFLPTVVNALFRNIWPIYEVRESCADLWNQHKARRIELALQSQNPAESLALLYADQTSLPFDSDDIFYAIRDMHEGAFLAVVNLWDPKEYNEDFLVTHLGDDANPLQHKILEYRGLVAKKIREAHITAARRYRINASSHLGFVRVGDETERCARLKSLVLLVKNVKFDMANNWIVDVEYCDDHTRHFAALDYALLFGAQPPKGVLGATADVAYITDSRQTLIAEGDYQGVRLKDPMLVAALMKDRFWASKGIKQAEDFVRETTQFIESELDRLTAAATTPETCKAQLVGMRTILQSTDNKSLPTAGQTEITVPKQAIAAPQSPPQQAAAPTQKPIPSSSPPVVKAQNASQDASPSSQSPVKVTQQGHLPSGIPQQGDTHKLIAPPREAEPPVPDPPGRLALQEETPSVHNSPTDKSNVDGKDN